MKEKKSRIKRKYEFFNFKYEYFNFIDKKVYYSEFFCTEIKQPKI